MQAFFKKKMFINGCFYSFFPVFQCIALLLCRTLIKFPLLCGHGALCPRGHTLKSPVKQQELMVFGWGILVDRRKIAKVYLLYRVQIPCFWHNISFWHNIIKFYTFIISTSSFETVCQSLSK